MKDVSKLIYKIKYKFGFKKVILFKIFVIIDNIFFYVYNYVKLV